MIISGGKRKAPSEDALLSSSPNAALLPKRPFRMNVSGGKRIFPSQGERPPSTSAPSNEPFRMNVSGVNPNMPSEDPLFTFLANAMFPSENSPPSDELKFPIASEFFDAASELQTSFKKFSERIYNAPNKSNPPKTPGSLDGVSRLHESIPSTSPYDRISQSGRLGHSQRKTTTSLNMINDGEHNSLDPHYGIDEPSLNFSSDEDGERRCNSRQPLWTGMTRRPHCMPSAANEEVYKVTKSYLIAMIFSGAAGDENTAWLKSKEMWVSDAMKQAWEIMSTRVGRNTGRIDYDAAAEPPPQEARLFLDIMNDWRSRAVQAVRYLVGISYPWSECETPEDVRQLCTDLLKDDCFTCLERTAEPPRGRFCAYIISTALQQIYWNPKNLGIALHAHTKDLFDPLSAAAVVFACTCIEHTIREYKSGYFSKTLFRGPAVTAAQTRFRNIFDNQSHARKSLQQILILRRIHEQIDMKKLLTAWKVDAVTDAVNNVVADPYSQGIDDLPLHELGGGKKSQGVLVNQRHDKSSGSSKSCNLNLKNQKPVENENMREDVEDETASLNKNETMGPGEIDGGSSDFSVEEPHDMERMMEGKKASNSKTVNQWTSGDLWGFLETPKVGRLRWVSGNNLNAPTDKVISDEEEYNRFLLWVKGEKGKHRRTPIRVEQESGAVPEPATV